MSNIFELAGRVSTIWSLAAFAIAAILYLSRGRIGRPSKVWGVAIAGIAVLGMVPIIGSLYVEMAKNRLEADRDKSKHKIVSIYRVRITVLDPDKIPVNDARVWSSAGGEPKKIEGGWQFDIPLASKPADNHLTVYAKVENTALVGQAMLNLDDDFNPNSTILLSRDESAIIRGIVLDDLGHALEGVRVSVVGYGAEGIITKVDGGFVLGAHVANGQVVRLHAEKTGYDAISQDHPAGGLPATLVLHIRGP